MIKTIVLIVTLLTAFMVPQKVPEIVDISFTELDLESNDADEMEQIAQDLFDQRLFKEALPIYQKLVSLNSNNIRYCSHLATCLHSVKDYENSLTYALKALKLMNWTSTECDVPGYEFEAEESTLNVAKILLTDDFYDPVRSLPYWDAMEYYCAKKDYQWQRNIEYHLVIMYSRGVAYYKAGDETTSDQILNDICDSEIFKKAYDNWCITHETTDLGDEPYELYKMICDNWGTDD